MVVTVIAMRMVKMPIDQIIDVVAVRHCFMSATRSVNMVGIVSLADMSRRAAVGIGVADLQRVLFDLTVVADVM